ncbi:hypothetical protein NEOLEDRAFT_1025814, partial [Neolentinus lepideus HHB14362 ss-1]
AQRDVLEALSFTVAGNCPAAYMEEIYHSLEGSALEQLMLIEDGLWKSVQDEAFKRLFDALYDTDVLQFPVSLLTVASLFEALIDAMAEKY